MSKYVISNKQNNNLSYYIISKIKTHQNIVVFVRNFSHLTNHLLIYDTVSNTYITNIETKYVYKIKFYQNQIIILSDKLIIYDYLNLAYKIVLKWSDYKANNLLIVKDKLILSDFKGKLIIVNLNNYSLESYFLNLNVDKIYQYNSEILIILSLSNQIYYWSLLEYKIIDHCTINKSIKKIYIYNNSLILITYKSIHKLENQRLYNLKTLNTHIKYTKIVKNILIIGYDNYLQLYNLSHNQLIYCEYLKYNSYFKVSNNLVFVICSDSQLFFSLNLLTQTVILYSKLTGLDNFLTTLQDKILIYTHVQENNNINPNLLKIMNDNQIANYTKHISNNIKSIYL